MLSDAIGCIGFSWVSYPNGPKTKGYWERFCIMTKTDENCLKMDLSIVCMWGYSESCLKKFTSFNQISNESKKFTFFFQAASPSCTELETIVLDWLGKLHYIYVLFEVMRDYLTGEFEIHSDQYPWKYTSKETWNESWVHDILPSKFQLTTSMANAYQTFARRMSEVRHPDGTHREKSSVVGLYGAHSKWVVNLVWVKTSGGPYQSKKLLIIWDFICKPNS